jgi:hypothetical protein
MIIITKQLAKHLPIKTVPKGIIVDPTNVQNIIHTLKQLKKEETVVIYDKTVSKEKDITKPIQVKDHVNKTGLNPLVGIQQKLKIDFIDLSNLYGDTGVVTTCCGKKLDTTINFPSHYLSNLTIIAKSMGVKTKAYLIKCKNN